MKRKISLLVMAGVLSSRGVLAGEAISNFTGQEMVVTATKTVNMRKDIPNAVIVINQTEIKASTALSVGELLANRSGIDLGSYGNYGGAVEEIHMRGMNADGTQVFVNGVRMNSISLGSADVAKIPLSNIERIEIVKGSGSLLYGSGASGGVINIFTREPVKDKTDFSLTSEYGTQGTYGIALSHGKAITDKLAYLMTLGKKVTDGFRDNSDLDDKNASIKFAYHNSDSFNASLSGDFVDREYGMPGVQPPAGTVPYYDLSGVAYYNNESASLLNRHEDRDGHVVMHIDGKASGKLHYNFQTDYSYSRSYNYQRDTSGYYSSKTWVTNQVKTAEGNLTFKPFGGFEILAGCEFRHYDYENRQAPMDFNFNPEFDERHDLHSSALYTEVQYRPAQYLKLQSGIRREENSMFGTKNVFRYGAVVNLSENTAIKFNCGSHFKAPTMNDLFWPDDGWTKGNLSLSPEKGWHTDVTIEQELGDKGLFTAGYFHWNIKDKIAWAPDHAQQNSYGYDYWVPTNLDTYKADGLELSVRAKLSECLAVSLDYTLLYAVEEKSGTAERQSLYTPRQQFKSQITYSDRHGLSVTPSLSLMDRRPYYSGSNVGSVPTRSIASYWLLDLKATKRISGHFSVSLNASNLLDKYYVTRLEDFYEATFPYSKTLSPYPGAGRAFLMSFTYKY